MRKIKIALLLAALTAMLLMIQGGMSVSAASGSGTVDVSVTYMQTEARSMLSLINQLRTEDASYWDSDDKELIECEGLSELTYDYNLEKVAMQRAVEIAFYGSHTRPDGRSYSTIYSEMGYSCNAYEEFITYNYYDSAKKTFNSWYESNDFYKYSQQEHRRAMLSDAYNVCAVACVHFNNTYYWVMELANTTNSSTETSANNGETTVSVNVTGSLVELLVLYPDPESISMIAGDSTNLPTVFIKIMFEDGGTGGKSLLGDISYTWTSGDTSIATISGGKLIAQNAGTTKLTTSFLGVTAQVPVTVTKDISKCTISLGKTSYTYDGSAKRPSVTVKSGNKTLKSGTDYTVSYKNNTNAGTATVTIAGKGNYTGSVKKNFTINKASQTLTAKASSSSIVKGKTATITASGKGTISYSSNKKSVATVSSKGKITAKAIGTAKITVKAAGNSNYKSASKTLTIKVVPKATTLSSAKSSSSKKLTVKWKKVSGVSGYQIQYSTSKTFKSGNKSVNVSGASKVSKTVSKLKKGKTYYVRVRTYKKVSGTTYYSSWSSNKKVKVK